MVRGTQAAPAGGLPSPPTILGGRYEIGPILGCGGTATVYRARDCVLRRDAAIKLFHPGVLGSDDRRLKRELTALGKLRHPGVVELYEVGTHGPQAFLAMQLVEGQTLAERLAHGRLRPAVTIALGTRLADTLAHVHGQGVTHRDLKPGNVLLGADGALISDFGVAKIVDDTLFTGTGIIVGTASYMAPEQVSGQTVGPPADIYALGLVLLECVTGRREYAGGPLEAAVARLHRQPVVPDNIPLGLATLLRQMTSSDPAKRPAAGKVALDLRSIPLNQLTIPVQAAIDDRTDTEPCQPGDTSFAESPAVRASRLSAASAGSRHARARTAIVTVAATAAALAAGVLMAVLPVNLRDSSGHTGTARPAAPHAVPAPPPPVAPGVPWQPPPSTSTPASPVIEEEPPTSTEPQRGWPGNSGTQPTTRTQVTTPELPATSIPGVPEIPAPTSSAPHTTQPHTTQPHTTTAPSMPTGTTEPSWPTRPSETEPSGHSELFMNDSGVFGGARR